MNRFIEALTKHFLLIVIIGFLGLTGILTIFFFIDNLDGMVLIIGLVVILSWLTITLDGFLRRSE